MKHQHIELPEETPEASKVNEVLRDIQQLRVVLSKELKLANGHRPYLNKEINNGRKDKTTGSDQKRD